MRKEHLTGVMSDMGRFGKNHYGYRKGSGTGDVNFDLVNELFQSRNNGKVTGALFVDFTEAFNSVIHSKLQAS